MPRLAIQTDYSIFVVVVVVIVVEKATFNALISFVCTSFLLFIYIFDLHYIIIVRIVAAYEFDDELSKIRCPFVLVLVLLLFFFYLLKLLKLNDGVAKRERVDYLFKLD